jgi:hypothetical protein
MSLCALCGGDAGLDASLCEYHSVSDAGWAAGNRALCDFLHRGKPLARLPSDQRDDMVASTEDP